MINIVNCLLTRKCNLKCTYCRISGEIDYDLAPIEYPKSGYYYTSEKSPEWWIEFIGHVRKENPHAFFILYGGEPLLYKGLATIVKHLNEVDANYTIISNSTTDLNKLRAEFFREVGPVKGWTASVDPGFETMGETDEEKKSNAGYYLLKRLIGNGLVADPVAEITCDRESIFKVEETIKRLSAEGIWSDLTVLDIAKTNWYDFSAVVSPEMLVPKTEAVKKVFDRLIASNYKIHMKEQLLPRIYDILPAELDCDIRPHNLHSICVESDGSLRLCLRIKGHFTTKYSALDLFTNGRLIVEQAIEGDKQTLCKGCSHTCYIMSQLDYEDIVNH